MLEIRVIFRHKGRAVEAFMKLALLFSILFSISAFGAGRCPTWDEGVAMAKLERAYDFKALKKSFLRLNLNVDLCEKYGTSLGWATQIYGKMWDEDRLDELKDYIDFLLKNGANPNIPLAKESERPIDELTNVCATDTVYKLIAYGAEFKKPYFKAPFLTYTILKHTQHCAELADFFINKQNMPVIEQDACLAFRYSKKEWNAQYDRDLREAGFSGQALPVFIKKIKEQYGWDVPLNNSTYGPDLDKYCDELRERDMPAPRN